MTLRWIAACLRMGRWNCVSNWLRETRRTTTCVKSEARHLHGPETAVPATAGAKSGEPGAVKMHKCNNYRTDPFTIPQVMAALFLLE
jgi:hypothetical protein